VWGGGGGGGGGGGKLGCFLVGKYIGSNATGNLICCSTIQRIEQIALNTSCSVSNGSIFMPLC